LILILIRTHVLAVGVVIAAAVVVVVVAIGARGCSRSDRRGSVSGASRYRISSRIARDRTARAAGNGITRTARTASYRMARPNSSRIVTSAARVNASSMDRAAMEATTSASIAAAPAAAGKRLVRNQCRANKHDRREKYESIPEHVTPPCDWVPMLLDGTQSAGDDAASIRVSEGPCGNSRSSQRSGLR